MVIFSLTKVNKYNVCSQVHAFSMSNTFYNGSGWLKLAKNQANAKLNPCHFKIIHILHTRFHPKIIGHIQKNKQKNKCVCIHDITQLIIMKMRMKMKMKSHTLFFIRTSKLCLRQPDLKFFSFLRLKCS